MRCGYTEPTVGAYIERKMMEAKSLTPSRFVLSIDVWEEMVMLKFISLVQSDPELKNIFTRCYCSYDPLLSNPREVLKTGLQVSNFSVGGLSLWKVYQGKYLQWNELWHKTKTAGYAFRWQKRWDNPGARYWRSKNISTVSNSRKWATRATKVGGVLLVADIALTGEIKPSHAINAAMLGASTTGVGSIVAGVWFLADTGTLLFNLAVYQENKSLSDIIDQSIGYSVNLY